MVVGIDEVGRGCWAGPLCAAAVGLLKPVEGLKDSKMLSVRQRENLALKIRQSAYIGIGWASAELIDTVGLTASLRVAMKQALGQLQGGTQVRLDGNYNYLSDCELPVELVVGGDKAIPEISAASIVAKVARDKFMKNAEISFPGYGFGVHVGYGTKQHILALERLGPSLLHRQSYKPVRRYL